MIRKKLKRNKYYWRIKNDLNNLKAIFFPATFSEKYQHVGYSYPGVPDTWVKTAKEAVIQLEKLIWPQKYLPFFIKRLIHFLGTDNSIVRVKFKWFYNLRNYLTNGTMILDIKDKYATLRIYGIFTPEMYDVVNKAEMICLKTCEKCGVYADDVKPRNLGWVRNYCDKCNNNLINK